MYPVLFSGGSITIFSYGFMIALGLLCVFMLVKRHGVQCGMSSDKIIDCIIMTTCAGIAGARILYIIRFSEYYRNDLLGIFRIWEGGLILYGGTIMALFFLYVYSIRVKKNFFELTDMLVPYFVFVQGFGRIGCFLNGCCGGKTTDSIFGVCFPHMLSAVHPTQIYSALYCFIIAAVLWMLAQKKRQKGCITTVYFLLYSVARFLVEFLRVNDPVVFGFTDAQIISFVLFVAASGVFIIKKYWIRYDT